MEEQNFRKHAQYIPGFHFLTFTLILAALAIAIIITVHAGISHATVFYLLVALSLGLLFFYLRQFATNNQDRIIRAEENFRCFRLTGKTLDNRLSRQQVIALRFADDDEYAELTEKTINQKLDPKAIKAAIQKWKADHHRV